MAIIGIRFRSRCLCSTAEFSPLSQSTAISLCFGMARSTSSSGVIGLPGDRIRMTDGALYLNGKEVERRRVADFVGGNPCSLSRAGSPVSVRQWRETLPNGASYSTLRCGSFAAFPDFTGVYTVPPGHFFVMGDNREDSEDSRFPDVGYVPFIDLIGRARLIFFSISPDDPIWEFWNWPWSIRWSRLFTLVR